MLLPESDDEKLMRQLNEKLNAYRTPAPEGLWDEIFHDMNSVQENEASTADHIIDEKLKTAANQKHIAPEFIWYGIEQKLNLDSIWNAMQPELNKIRKRYIYRKVLSYVSTAAILLLLIRGCGLGEYGIDTTMPDTLKLQTAQKHQQNIISNEKKLAHNNSSKEQGSNTLNWKNFASNTANDNFSSDNYSGLSTEVNSTIQNDGLSGAIISAQSYDILDSSTHNGMDMIEYEIKDPVEIASIRLNLLEMPNEEPELSIFEDQVKSKRNNRVNEYSFGLLAIAKSALFLNDQNYSKLNRIRAADVNLQPNLGFSYAVVVGTRFGKHAIDAEFYYNTKTIQHYNYMVSGRQHTDRTELNYTRVNLIYKPVLYSFKTSNIIANAGTYISNLKGANHSSTAHFASSNNFDVNSWETGIILGLGQEHRLSRNIVIDYGLRNEIGLTNVFKSDNGSRANTKLLGFGAYVALRYTFKK